MCLTIDVNHLLFISYSSWEHGNVYWKDWVTSLFSHVSLAWLSKVIFDSKFRSWICGWAQTFKEKKQVARSPVKTGKAKQTASRDGQWTLNPTKCKANNTEGKGCPTTLSACQNSQDSSSFVENKSWQGWRSLYFLLSLHHQLEPSPQQQPLAPAWGPLHGLSLG